MNEHVIQKALEGIKAGRYKKNIHWLFGPEMDIGEYGYVKALGGSPGMSTWMIQKAHHRVGVQMQVSKVVSDDLLATDFADAAKIENVPWPAPCVEVYFEDPLLPTILVMKCSPADIQHWFPILDTRLVGNEYITALIQEGSGETTGMHLSLQLTPDMYVQFLDTGETPSMDTGPLSHSLNEGDNAIMAYMLHLALKVFVFASIPQFKPAPIGKKQMTYGGKPNVKGRPNRPSFRTTYLPKIIRPRPHVEPSGKTIDFRGRRGHVRWYQSEKFTHRRGTWDFLQPIIDPHTGKYPERSILKVRKPQ